jgi:hypothetical protein
MHSSFPLFLEVASAVGSAGIGLRIRRKPNSIPALMAKVDTALMRRLYLLHEDRFRTQTDGAAVWRAIGGARGLPHFLDQARLLAKIIIEIHKQHPGEYDFQYDRIRGIRSNLWFNAGACLIDAVKAQFHPRMARVSTLVACLTFVNLAAECESVMEDAGYFLPGSMPHPC